MARWIKDKFGSSKAQVRAPKSCLSSNGETITTSREHLDWAVTEYGHVNLFGTSIRKIASLIISIAHAYLNQSELLMKAALEELGLHVRSERDGD
jgi:acyl-CoA hydrolase